MATKTSSKKTNQNYSAKLADGRKVTVKDGVKSYSGSVTNTSKVGDTVNGKKVGYIVGGNAYSSSKNAPGYSDTFEGKGTTSSGNDIYGNVITANKMKPAPKIPIATPAPIDGMFGITNAANAGLAALNGGTYDTKTNQMIPAPTSTQAPADNNQAILNAYLQANAGLEAPSAVNNLKEMEKMLKPKDKLVNSLTGQLNTLNASRDAAMLSLEGQGRGQTQGFVGGEQARINREAAIQAMPIQAQLAIAQDDLESARIYAGQYFQAKMQDETNAYNQKKENNRLVFEFLNAAEQRRVAANEKALDREYAEKQATSKSAEAIALQAIEYGQSSLATKVMGLDTKSPTYAADVRNAMAQLRKPVAATAPKAPTLQNFGTSDNPVWKQYNYETGSWDSVDASTQSVVTEQRNKTIADELATKITNIGSLKTHKGLNSAVGAVGLGRVGLTDAFGAKDEFIGKVEQLVSKEFLDTLVSAKAKGATFGALTKPEQDALTNAATAIGQWRMTDKETGKTTGYDIDETSFKNELDTLVTLAQKAESRARGYDVTVVPSYDSIIIDNLTKNYQSSLLTQDVSNFYPQ